MNKLILCAVLCVLLVLPITAWAEEDTDIIIQQELQAFDFSAWNYADEDFSLNAKEMIENYLNGEGSINTQGITDFVLVKLKNMVLDKLPLVFLLLAAGIMSGLCNAVSPDERSEIRDVTAFIASAMCVAVVTSAVGSIVKSTVQAANSAASFAEAAMPVMSLIMIASGRSATEAVFSPVMAFLTGSATLIVKTFVIPIIIAGFVFAAVGALGGRTRTGKLTGLAKSAAKWICGIVTTVFTGAVGIYGLGAKAHDTLTMKTTKYVIDKSVPIVGNFIASSADTILECFTAIKTASGAVFMVVLILIAAKPLFDILSTIIAFRIAAAVCEPIADERIPKLMSDTADVAKYLFAAAVMINVMFIVAVGLCTCILS